MPKKKHGVLAEAKSIVHARHFCLRHPMLDFLAYISVFVRGNVPAPVGLSDKTRERSRNTKKYLWRQCGHKANQGFSGDKILHLTGKAGKKGVSHLFGLKTPSSPMQKH